MSQIEIPDWVVEGACKNAWSEFRSGMETEIWEFADAARRDRLRQIVRAALRAAMEGWLVARAEIMNVAPMPEVVNRLFWMNHIGPNDLDPGTTLYSIRKEPLELVREIEAVLAGNPNREAANPGGCECEKCGRVFIGAEWHVLCGICIDHGVAQPDGSGLRQGNNASANASETSPQPQVTNPAYTACNVEGTWLWGKLMDWCRARGTSPANFDSLFAIAREAHKLYASPQPAAEGSIPHGWHLVPRELSPPLFNALGFDSAFITHEEADQTWLEVIEAAALILAREQEKRNG